MTVADLSRRPVEGRVPVYCSTHNIKIGYEAVTFTLSGEAVRTGKGGVTNECEECLYGAPDHD